MSTKIVAVDNDPETIKTVWNTIIENEPHFMSAKKKLPHELSVKEFAHLYNVDQTWASKFLKRIFSEGKVTRRKYVDGKSHYFLYSVKGLDNIEA